MQETNFCSPDKLEEICRDYPTPFRLYDADGIINNVQKIYESFSWNRGFKDYFIVNTCPNPTIIKLLHKEGCGVVCSSLAELYLVEACGLKNEDIIFAKLNPLNEELRKAYSLGAIICLDNTPDRKVLAQAIGGKMPESINCHYGLGDTIFETDHAIARLLPASSGMQEDDIIHVFNRAHRYYHTNYLGIYSHLINCHSLFDKEAYSVAADQLFRAVVGLYSWSTRVSFVNFSVVNSTASHSIYPQKRTAAIAEKIHEKCDEILAPEGLEDTTIFTEISSSIVESCAYIVSRDLSRPNKPIAIYSAGPNDYSIGYRHSGILRPAEIILYNDGSFKEIRRAESLKDFFATIPEVERYFTYQVSNDEFFEH